MQSIQRLPIPRVFSWEFPQSQQLISKCRPAADLGYIVQDRAYRSRLGRTCLFESKISCHYGRTIQNQYSFYRKQPSVQKPVSSPTIYSKQKPQKKLLVVSSTKVVSPALAAPCTSGLTLSTGNTYSIRSNNSRYLSSRWELSLKSTDPNKT